VPLIDLVAVTLPGTGPIVVAVIATVVVIGVANAYLPAFAKLGASLGRDGDLPHWFAKGAEAGAICRHSSSSTPARWWRSTRSAWSPR
jgi:amino acid efflux transporter